MTLLVGAAGELRSDPEPGLAAHFIDAGEELLVLLLRPRLGAFGPGWSLALRWLFVWVLVLR